MPQVIVHTAIRTKVPFKKKVRGERSAKPKMPKSSSSNDAFKRHAGHQQSTSNPAALPGAAGGKKKKRVSAPVVDEDPAGTNGAVAPVAVHIETPPAHHASPSGGKLKSKSKAKSKHKEVIDYSKQNAHTNTFGKVQKWLLESHTADPASPSAASAAAVQYPTAVDAAPAAAVVRHAPLMSKSQSTPEHLAGKRMATVQPATAAAAATASSSNKPLTKVPSVSNLNDKVKLQVVYKPPFKFSLKFSKNSAVKTKVIGAAAGARQKPKQHRSLSHRPDAGEQQAHGSAAPSTRRTALLVQTLTGGSTDDAVNLVEHFDEPNYETLTPKRDAPATSTAAKSTPLYENVNLKADAATAAAASASTPINTATFRISKSASGSSLMQRTAAKSRASTSSSKRPSHSNSQTDLIREQQQQQQQHDNETPFGSSQNLIRSSTSNLAAKSGSRSSHGQSSSQPPGSSQHLSRSSTTNLSKQRRASGQPRGRGSNPNLNALDDGTGTGGSNGSRRNSLARQHSENAASMSRTSSQSNLRQAAAATQRPGDIVNNIPRANISGRHPVSSSFNRHARHAAGSAGKRGAERPHTADCTDGGPASSVHGFEWPPALKKSASTHAAHAAEPLPSDLEVMVSDVENLVTDDT